VFIHRLIIPALFTAALWSQIPNLEGVHVSGEIQSGNVVILGGYSVELRNQREDATASRAAVTSDGRFQFFNVPPGLYAVRVLSERQELVTEELRHIDGTGTPLEIRLPAEKQVRPGAGLISIKELAHPIPKKALKDFDQAERLLSDPARAIPKLEEAVLLAPQFRNAHANLGAMYGRVHRYADAVAEFQKVLDIGPPDAKTYMNLMSAYTSLHEFTEAEQAGRKAVALDTQNPRARFLLGYALAMQAGKEQDALKYLKLASPDVREAFLVSAQLRRRGGDGEGAKRDLEAYKTSFK
jgi:tetratricopeptide (TPR) repeat protein